MQYSVLGSKESQGAVSCSPWKVGFPKPPWAACYFYSILTLLPKSQGPRTFPASNDFCGCLSGHRDVAESRHSALCVCVCVSFGCFATKTDSLEPGLVPYFFLLVVAEGWRVEWFASNHYLCALPQWERAPWSERQENTFNLTQERKELGFKMQNNQCLEFSRYRWFCSFLDLVIMKCCELQINKTCWLTHLTSMAGVLKCNEAIEVSVIWCYNNKHVFWCLSSLLARALKILVNDKGTRSLFCSNVSLSSQFLSFFMFY